MKKNKSCFYVCQKPECRVHCCSMKMGVEFWVFFDATRKSEVQAVNFSNRDRSFLILVKIKLLISHFFSLNKSDLYLYDTGLTLFTWTFKQLLPVKFLRLSKITVRAVCPRGSRQREFSLFHSPWQWSRYCTGGIFLEICMNPLFLHSSEPFCHPYFLYVPVFTV